MKWWNNALIYQIYIRSFNKNINGIRNKIPYLKKLNIDAIWINPFFKDGGKDGGYDVIDYYNINENFGNLKDIKNMISDLHNNNIKLIIDLPLNHTSNKNQWFIDSENRNNTMDSYKKLKTLKQTIYKNNPTQNAKFFISKKYECTK